VGSKLIAGRPEAGRRSLRGCVGRLKRVPESLLALAPASPGAVRLRVSAWTSHPFGPAETCRWLVLGPLEMLARVMEDAQAMGACRSLGRRRLPNVIPAKAGTHAVWVPAFAWMTPQAIGQSFGRLFIRQPRIATAGPAVVRPRASASIHRCETVRKARWSPPRPRHIVLT
jgi:hypothetical protein